MTSVKLNGLRTTLRYGVAGLFAVSGTAHVARPKMFHSLIPRQLPARDAIVYGSGVAELVCAAGLFTQRSWAPQASAALLLAVWPGNLEYAVRVTRKHGIYSRAAAIGWGRMPLQIPMIWAVLGQDSNAPID